MNGQGTDGSDDLEQLLLGERFLLGLVAQLCAAYPSAGSGLAEEAVQEAVRKLVVRMDRPPPLRDVRAYLARVAYNTLNRIAPEVIDYEVPLEDRPDTPTPSAEDESLRDAAVKAVKEEIRTWSNANKREVMLIYVDAIALGEPIEAQEVADLVRPILGEEISAPSVRVWKQRGMADLRKFVEQNDWTERRATGGEAQG